MDHRAQGTRVEANSGGCAWSGHRISQRGSSTRQHTAQESTRRKHGSGACLDPAGLRYRARPKVAKCRTIHLGRILVSNYTALQCGQETKFLLNFSLESALRCEVNRDNPGHKYFLHRADSWVSHNKTISERKRGIRAVVTKSGSEVSVLSFQYLSILNVWSRCSESRGPYTSPYTVYFIHTRTAFSVRGVCKRFSEFKQLDAQIRSKFPDATMEIAFPPDQVLCGSS